MLILGSLLLERPSSGPINAPLKEGSRELVEVQVQGIRPHSIISPKGEFRPRIGDAILRRALSC